MAYELTIYAGGSAILTDHGGNPVWTSDSDEEFLRDFDPPLGEEDADDILDYLEEAGYVEDGDDVAVVASDASGLAEADDDDDDLEPPDDDDEDDDDDDDGPGDPW